MFKTLFNRKPFKGLSFVGLSSLCQRQFLKDTDINTLVARAVRGDTSVVVGRGKYLDVTSAPDSYHDVQNELANAQYAWQSLPDSVRHAYGTMQAFILACQRELSQPDTSSPDSHSDVSKSDNEKTKKVTVSTKTETAKSDA